MATAKKPTQKATKAAKPAADVKKTTAKKPVKQVKIEKTAKIPAAKAKAIEKPKTVKKSKDTSKEDTGSVDFQIENFSQKIKLLAKHLKTHTHDFDSRRGLLIMVGKRRRLLNYLKKSDAARYEEVAKSLKLKA